MNQPLPAGKCGLYCGICADLLLEKVCRGCGCMCKTCAAHWHHQSCPIFKCADEKGFTTCAECSEMPCTMLIQFANDPIWRTHLPAIENLRRIEKIGLDLWLEEQKDFFSDSEEVRKQEVLHQTCSEEWKSFNEN